MNAPAIGWPGVVRLGLVQMALGAVVVLTTSTLNRVMVIELALPALVPGLLVALHYTVQLARPRLGFGADVGGRCTPWIVGGMAVLGAGGVLAATGVAWAGSQRIAGLALVTLAFVLVGLGVAAAGTSLLVLLAKRVPEGRRAGAATVVWMMMIAGFALTAGLAGRWLEPYAPWRLVAVSGTVSLLAWLLTLAAVWRVEGTGRTAVPTTTAPTTTTAAARVPFRAALGQVWAEPVARRFTVFVAVSMLAFSAQDLILEPFAGTVFALGPGATTQLSGVQHGGVFVGMLAAALAGRRAFGSLRAWTVGGCLLSALALAGLAGAGAVGPPWPLHATVFALGAANGAFSIAAIGSMMHLAGSGRAAREGVRMGLWGAAQAIAFGAGGLLGAAASDVARRFITSPGEAYALVFALEALLFVVAARLAAAIDTRPATPHPTSPPWQTCTPTMPS
jgi:BCD family chlorophyll transporter-like MFS transporter